MTYDCKYCNRSFSQEKTLASHMCVKKRRFVDRDTIGARLGFRVFQRFYELTTNLKNPKSIEDFIDSSYYISFVKFGKHLALLDPINCNKFVDFVINHSIKLTDWPKDFVYETYLEDFVRKEPPIRALERTVIFMAEWAINNGCEYSDFFRNISSNEAVHHIRSGRISPWVLYLAESADDLFSKFNDEQYKLIESIINPGIWKARIIRWAEDKQFIEETLRDAGI